ncbi:MAG: hypothetical protein BWY90_00675 [Deltaproteobacteria bacterium ADurb.BinA014]|nr:MAG: hypothetical protein BWY90_00675 [Deltaproteobacteria bacterium ADurb.BinA014]
MIAETRRQLSQKPGHFHAGLNKTEDIVDHQKHILLGVVAEIFRHGQRRMPDAETRARRFIHLTEDHHGIAQNAAFFHFTVKLFTLAAPLADTAEDTHAFMRAHGVVNHLRNQNRLADTGTAEKSGFPAPFQRRQNVNGLDPRFENFRNCGLVLQGNRVTMNAAIFVCFHRAFFVNCVAEDIKHSSQEFFADGDFKGLSGIRNR